MKRGFCDDIDRLTVDNEDFRRVLMTLQAGEDIGEEVHADRDQFFRFEEGNGVVDIDGRENPVEDDFAVIVPAGARHNVRNTSNAPLRFYTLYGPPEHKDKIVHRTKEEAEKRHPHEEWDGKTTE